jgi:hypothetical protein
VPSNRDYSNCGGRNGFILIGNDTGHIIDLLRTGPKTIREIIQAFENAANNPAHVTMSPRKVHRVCRNLEEYPDQVIVAHIEKRDGRCVRLFFLREDLDYVERGHYGDILLPYDFLKSEVPGLKRILMKSPVEKGGRRSVSTKGLGAKGIIQHKLTLRRRASLS